MFNLCIFRENSTVQYVMCFKTQESAKAQRENIRNQQKSDANITTVKDDYGNEIDFHTSDIGTVHIEDVEKSYWQKIDADIISKRVAHAFGAKRNDDIELIKLYPAAQSINPPRGGMQ